MTNAGGGGGASVESTVSIPEGEKLYIRGTDDFIMKSWTGDDDWGVATKQQSLNNKGEIINNGFIGPLAPLTSLSNEVEKKGKINNGNRTMGPNGFPVAVGSGGKITGSGAINVFSIDNRKGTISNRVAEDTLVQGGKEGKGY